MPLDSGGGGGSSSSSDELDDGEMSNAGSELAQRDPTAESDPTTSSTSRSRDTGITSGGGDVVSESPVSDDSPEDDGSAEDELTSRDPGSGDGGAQDTGADDELTSRDPGSDDADLSDAGQELTGRDAGSRDVTQIRSEAIQQQAEAAAEDAVDIAVQEGVEGEAGREVEIDGRTLDVREQARDLEQRAIEQAEWADDPSDVAIRVENGRLVAGPSRSAAVDETASRFEEDLRRDFALGQRRHESITLQGGPGADTPDEQLEAAERELETTEATIPVPDRLPFDDITLSGQTRDVELEQIESGDIEVTEQERFGDFDFNVPGPVAGATAGLIFGPAGFAIGGLEGARQGGTDREFEDLTGAAGDRLIEGGEVVGDVLARELVEERTVIPGAIVEERIQGDTDFVASATRNVPVGVASIGDQALNLPQEAAEFAAEGVSRTAQGEGREFAGAVGGAAVGAGILTAREAVRDPGAFTGQLAGSAVGASGGVAAATRLAGPRAGRIVSTAVQPGEELAIVAARRGVVSPRAASLVPGVRRDHIGETAGEAATTDAVVEDVASRPGVRERMSSRLPSVTVEADPEAGVLEIDPDIRAAIERTPGQVRESVVSTGEAVRAAPSRAAERVDATAFEAGVRTGEASRRVEALPGELRSGVSNRLDALDETAFRAGVRTGEATRRAEEFIAGAEAPSPTSVREVAARGVRRADQAVFETGRRTGERLRAVDETAFEAGVRTGRRVSDAEDFIEGLPGEVDDAAFEAGVRTGERIRDVEDLVVSTGRGVDDAAFEAGVRVGEATRQIQDAPGAVRGAASERLGDLDDTAFEAGVRAGQRVSDAEDFIAGLPGEVDDAAFKAGVRTGETISDVENLLGQAGGGATDIAFQTGVRVGEASRRVEALPGAARSGVASAGESIGEGIDDFIIRAQRGPAVTGDVALQQAFLRGSDLPYPSLDEAVRAGRRRQRQVAGVASSVSEVPGAVTGAVRREATGLRFRGAETIAEGRRFAQDVSDVTVRVGDPPRPTIFETDSEDTAPVVEADGPEDTPFDADTGTEAGRSETGGDDDLDEPLDPTRTGVGIETEIGAPAMGQRLLIRSETESESASIVEPLSETESDASLRPRELTREEPEIQVDEPTDFDVEQGPDVTLDEDVALEPVAETRLDTQQETRQEQRQEIRTEIRQETRQEQRQELRTEVAAEPASEIRTELDTDSLLRDNNRDNRRRRRGGAFTEEFEFGVASPEEVLSGEESGLLDES